MINKEKQLLLKDLCARLPYGIIVHIHDIDVDDYDRQLIGEDLDLIELDRRNCKPYLRPMSSMTEKEKQEYSKIVVKSQDCIYANNESATTIVNDWYLSKGFDVRGLIPKGLALEAPEEMYKTE